jgi:hypothetical protein
LTPSPAELLTLAARSRLQGAVLPDAVGQLQTARRLELEEQLAVRPRLATPPHAAQLRALSPAV